MKRLFLAVMLALIACGANADWSVVINRDAESVIYADPTTIRRAGNKVKLWVLWDYKEPKKTSGGTPYSSSKHQVEYDCKDERDQLLYVVRYENAMGKGSMVSSVEGTNKSAPIVPGTIGDGVWQYACNKRYYTLQETRPMKHLALTILLFVSGESFACSFDTDCQMGSKCVKARGEIYGICAGGIAPGNRNDRQPITAPLDINRTYGNTCSFDTECGPGSRCAKSSGAIQGVCVGGR